MGLTPGVGVMKKKGKEEKRWDMRPQENAYEASSK